MADALRKMQSLPWLLAGVLAAIGLAAPALAEIRIALVIGNAAYEASHRSRTP